MPENPILRTEDCELCRGTGKHHYYTWPLHCLPECVHTLRPYHPNTFLCDLHSSMSNVYMPVLWTVEQQEATLAHLRFQVTGPTDTDEVKA